MKTHIAKLAFFSIVAVAGCGSASAQETLPATPDNVSLAPPPPPPAAPPPEAASANPSAAPSVPASDPPPAPPPAPAAPAGAQAGPLPALPSQAPQAGAAQAQAAPADPGDVAPPPAQWVYSYPTGQWVYTTTYGWIWVPAGSETATAEGVPYAYLYTPSYGWTWYVSPWGPGVYRYGVWVRHPWVPRGWHRGWVAHPRVIVRGGVVVRGGRGHRH